MENQYTRNTRTISHDNASNNVRAKVRSKKGLMSVGYTLVASYRLPAASSKFKILDSGYAVNCKQYAVCWVELRYKIFN